MNSAKKLLFTVAGLAIAGVLAVFTASLALALLGVGTVLLAARAISMKLQPQPVPVYAHSRSGRDQVQRVWNDGRGTIIDM